MAQTAWPFENIDTTETQFSQWARNIGEGVKGSSGGTELKPFGDSTGMNVKVYAGQSMVRGHYYVSTATETLTIATSDPTNPRIDSVVLELDPTANTILLKVLTGTPASSPSATTLTQSDAGIWQQLLGTVAVAAGAGLISAGNVTDARSFLGITSIAWTAITDKPSTFPSTWDTVSGKPTSYSSAIITTGVTDKSANYTITSDDKNTLIRATSGSATTITIANVLGLGESINFIQWGSGQLSFSAGSGVTIGSADGKLKINKRYSGATITCVASGLYSLVGDLAA
jgi:hypothetical protein